MTPSEQKPPSVLKVRLRLNEVLGCSYGCYPWDHWEQYAKARGVPERLAVLGALVIREAYQHDWEPRLKSLCGWRDDGRRMIKLALRSPERARRRWRRLLSTDGYQPVYDPRTGRWRVGQ